MTLQYQEVYDRFLQKITDYSFLEYDANFIYDSMKGWLHSAASQPLVRAKFSTLSFDDEIIELNFALNTSVDDDSDKYFVAEILSRGMVIEWLEPQVKSQLHINQFFGGKEQKWFAQANHLNSIRQMLEDAKKEQRKMIRDYGYVNNSYIGGEA